MTMIKDPKSWGDLNNVLSSGRDITTLMPELGVMTTKCLIDYREIVKKLSKENKMLKRLHTEAVLLGHESLDELDRLKEAKVESECHLGGLVVAEMTKANNRMKNVCRLANAARAHIERQNYAIADQLLAPLSQGVHDAYQEKEDEKRNK